MDFKTQLTGLNELLSVIYGEEMHLSTLLAELGFEPVQIEQLKDQHLESVVRQFLEVVHKRLTNDAGRDTYYQILSRRYRLDGEPREQLSAKLERLSNLRGAADLARLDYESKRTEILKQVQAELDTLDLEYKPTLEATEENIAALENEIKTEVLLYGESVSGGFYRASFTQGRVSWDNEGMTKYAALHPDVLQFRKQGQPVVSLRVVNKE